MSEKYKEKVVCFIDILGFQNYVNESTKSSKKRQLILNALNFIKDEFNEKKKFYNSKMVTQFSDSIVISYDVEEISVVWELINDIQSFLIGLIKHGFLCRGAIVKGKLIHTEDMIFGPAMNEVVKLEKDANTPRVIVSNQVINLSRKYKQKNHTPEQEKGYVKEFLCKDYDYYYIDYLENIIGCDGLEYHYKMYLADDYKMYLKDINHIIKIGLKNKNERVKNKYKWLNEKYKIAKKKNR